MDDLLPAPQPLRAGVHQALQPQPGASPDLMPAQEAGGAPSEQDATPEEQAQYDKLAGKALRFIAAKGPQALKLMRPVGKETPPEALGRFVATLMRNLDSSARRAGEDLSGDVVFNAATEVAEEVTRLAVKAGIIEHPKDPDRLANEVAVSAANDQIKHEKARGNPMQQEASDFVAQQVAQEVDSGAAPQGFLSKQGGRPDGGTSLQRT